MSRGNFLSGKKILTAWLLSALPLASYASCAIESAPVVSGMLRISSWTMSKGAKLQGPPLMAQVSFKCDSETNFHLSLAGEDGDLKKPIVLTDKSGTKLTVLPKLRSVDSNPVNMLFAMLPNNAYSGRAAAGKTYQVIVDLIPTDTTVMKVSAQDQFAGNFQIYLN